MRVVAGFILYSIVFSSFSQVPSYWIRFTDKNNSNYSISQPLQFLSQRSLDRRIKTGVPVVTSDLPVNKDYIDSILNTGNIQLLNTSKWFNAIAITSQDSLALAAIQTYAFVSSVTKVKSLKKVDGKDKFEKLAESKNNVDLYNIPHYPYGYTYSQLALHEVDKLQDLGFKGQGMHIAIFDAGFYRANELEALSSVFSEDRIVSTHDFVNGGVSVYEDHTHGSMVFSIIAGSIAGEYRGTAPKASFHLLRTEDANSETLLEEYNWVSAAEYADSAGVDIINTSLGYTTFDDVLQNHTYSDLDGNTTIIAQAADLAASKGMLLCTSAGNSGNSPWQYISTPADADSTLTVAAVDSVGARAFFSSIGPSSDGDVKPNVASVGWNTYIISPWTGEIMQGNGTSFSSPMMAGMAACLWQALPGKTNMEIKQLIEENSSQYVTPDSLLGFGIPNFYQAFSRETGIEYSTPVENLIEDVFPNPVDDVVNIIFISKIDQEIILRIYSDKGEIILSESERVLQGKNQLVLSGLRGVAQGNYILELHDGERNKLTAKIIII